MLKIGEIFRWFLPVFTVYFFAVTLKVHLNFEDAMLPNQDKRIIMIRLNFSFLFLLLFIPIRSPQCIQLKNCTNGSDSRLCDGRRRDLPSLWQGSERWNFESFLLLCLSMSHWGTIWWRPMFKISLICEATWTSIHQAVFMVARMQLLTQCTSSHSTTWAYVKKVQIHEMNKIIKHLKII